MASKRAIAHPPNRTSVCLDAPVVCVHVSKEGWPLYSDALSAVSLFGAPGGARNREREREGAKEKKKDNRRRIIILGSHRHMTQTMAHILNTSDNTVLGTAFCFVLFCFFVFLEKE